MEFSAHGLDEMEKHPLTNCMDKHERSLSVTLIQCWDEGGGGGIYPEKNMNDPAFHRTPAEQIQRPCPTRGAWVGYIWASTPPTPLNVFNIE